MSNINIYEDLPMTPPQPT